jgi:hypothetical protein
VVKVIAPWRLPRPHPFNLTALLMVVAVIALALLVDSLLGDHTSWLMGALIGSVWLVDAIVQDRRWRRRYPDAPREWW